MDSTAPREGKTVLFERSIGSGLKSLPTQSRNMRDYPGVWKALSRYVFSFLSFGLFEWVLELLGGLVALVVLLIWYPEGVGYFFVGLTALVLNNVGRSLEEGKTEQEESIQEGFEKMESPSRSEIMGYVFGLYLVLAMMISGILLTATAVATVVSVFLDQPMLALAIAALLPVVDAYIGDEFGYSLSGAIGSVVGRTLLTVLRLYGIRSTLIKDFTDRHRFIP